MPQILNITGPQDSALNFLAQGKTLKDTADNVDVTIRTISRWLLIPGMKEELERRKLRYRAIDVVENKPEEIPVIRGSDHTADLEALLKTLSKDASNLAKIGDICLGKAISIIQNASVVTVREAVLIGELGLKCKRVGTDLWQESLGVQALAAELEKRKENA